MINNIGIQIDTKNFLDINSKIFNVKQYFQSYVYSNEEFKENLVNYLSQNMELFCYNYTPTSLSLKIKKTTLKKDPEYKHESIYYYNIINQSLYQALQPIISTINDPEILELISNKDNMSLFYSITSLNDNIINIYF